jgi:hypothetical protein
MLATFPQAVTVLSIFFAAGGCNEAATTDRDTGTIPETDVQTDCADVEDVSIGVLENEIVLEGRTVTKTVNTVLTVRWNQLAKADSVHLRFTFENDEWFESPSEPGTVGSHEIPVLGVPELTEVTIQIIENTNDSDSLCEISAATGQVPKSIPRATVTEYNPSFASSFRWMIGSVENTPDQNSMYAGPFTLYIIDRQGRIVWYYLDQAWNPAMAYPRIAPDGTHIVVERSIRAGTNSPSIVRTTLDFKQFQEYETPGLSDSMDVTDDGCFVYNSMESVIELCPNGTERAVWSCLDWAQLNGVQDTWAVCYANSVVWNPLSDSIVVSYPYQNTVVEIDRHSGELIGRWGDLGGSWAFDPTSTGFSFEHGANITKDGTLLVSTHTPGTGQTDFPVPHFFLEFELDRQNLIAKEIWRYGEGLNDWPRWKGEVYPVEGGNRLVNWGTEGVLREVTPNNETAWEVKWEADFDNDMINKMVGHTILIDDLYALCKGWEK